MTHESGLENYKESYKALILHENPQVYYRLGHFSLDHPKYPMFSSHLNIKTGLPGHGTDIVFWNPDDDFSLFWTASCMLLAASKSLKVNNTCFHFF